MITSVKIIILFGKNSVNDCIDVGDIDLTVTICITFI